jgi:hypothetical protein
VSVPLYLPYVRFTTELLTTALWLVGVLNERLGVMENEGVYAFPFEVLRIPDERGYTFPKVEYGFPRMGSTESR